MLSGVTPPFFEDRNLVRNARTNRIDVNVVRYHQGGWATGTITVDGETHELGAEMRSGSVTTRGVSARVWATTRPTSSPPSTARPDRSGGMMKWSPAFFRRPDGTYYETAIFVSGGAWHYTSAYVNDADGTAGAGPLRGAAHGVRPAHALRAPW